MELKDYYTILELSPSASQDDIKKSYRRLAQLYHPDKKSDDPYAAIYFSAIKEAYETLMHPAKKDAYLQERWYAKSMGRNTNGTGIVTPVVILKQLLELEKYIRKTDVHRMDRHSWYNHLVEILSSNNIEMLNSFNDNSTNREIIFSAIRIMEFFDSSQLIILEKNIHAIKCDDESIAATIRQMIIDKRQQVYWEKRKGWLIMTAALLICVIIYVASKS